MIRLGLRLTVAGGRDALTRLALIAAAVAIGVGLLLATLAGINGTSSQNARYAWLETDYAQQSPQQTASTVDPLWWRLRADFYQGNRLGRVDLAATGPNSPVPPGIPALPRAGEYYASPALARLIRTVPASQLADRFPGRLIGTIAPAGLPAPDSLIVVVGHSAAELSHQDGADQVSAISHTAPSNCGEHCAPGVGIDANGMVLVLSVVSAALLFPVLIFIGGATRLSAAQREQRFAAMRLVGATPRQISVISTVESCMASVVGVLVGFAAFYALRPALTGIRFTGEKFYPSDLSLTPADLALVGLGIPVAAAIVAQFALRRVNISPLGVTRRTTPRPPRGWRVLPLLGGIVELGYLAYGTDIGNSHHYSSASQASLYLAGVLLIMSGLVIAGPWLTMLAARLLAGRANRSATLIAARRLADNPNSCFRAVSGLVLALFVGTCSLGIITTIVAHDGGSADRSPASAGTVVTGFIHRPDEQVSTAVAPATLTALKSTPGVTGVSELRRLGGSEDPAGRPTFVSCAQLAGTPALGRCPAGAAIVRIEVDYGGAVVGNSSMIDTTWPVASLPAAQLATLPIDSLAVETDGSPAAVEQVRTLLGAAYPATFAPQTLKEIKAEGARQLNSFRQLANVVIATSLPIAGCSLAVSMVGGLAERKRPFSLLRLTGTPLQTLRRVITLETAAPLLITALVSIGSGLLAAHLFLHAQLHEAVLAPDLQYYLIVSGGLLASLATIASTMPLLARITGPEVARND